MNVDFWKGFGIGIGLGTCIGIGLEIAYEKYQDKKYQDEVWAEAKQTGETYLKHLEDGIVEFKDSGVLMTDSFEINPIGGDSDGNSFVSYSKFYAPETNVEDTAAEEINDIMGDPTELIDEKEFNSRSEFEKVFCAYAQDDEGKWMLTNDNGNEEMVIENTIGTKHLDAFPTTKEDEQSIIFVRNNEKMVDYMVTKYVYVE